MVLLKHLQTWVVRVRASLPPPPPASFRLFRVSSGSSFRVKDLKAVVQWSSDTLKVWRLNVARRTRLKWTRSLSHARTWSGRAINVKTFTFASRENNQKVTVPRHKSSKRCYTFVLSDASLRIRISFNFEVPTRTSYFTKSRGFHAASPWMDFCVSNLLH